jgi:hypothetical protein
VTLHRTLRSLPLLLAALAAAIAAAPAAATPRAGRSFAAVRMTTSAVSTNWAGYAVTGASHRAVSGTWVQPTASCTAGTACYSAFWVGLGGFSEESQALEQVGTSSDCATAGRPVYSVWYELVPAASVPVKLKLAAGDTVSATVVVDGTRVTVRIRNVTRGTVFTKRLTLAAPDVSSAEWVAEAPAACTASGCCRVLPLANFGTVAFSQSAAATVDGGTGTISSPVWSATPIELVPTVAPGVSPAGGAQPGELSPDGTAFSVAWRDAAAA